MKEPLISIYTPTYKRNRLLRERALKSVLNQTYTNWEYIIVSDGKNPELREFLDSYGDNRIRFYEIKRKRKHHNYDTEQQWYIGACYPANFALDQVKGEWIARLDDDDIWTKDHLEKLLKFAQENDYEFITSKYVYEKNGEQNVFNGIYIESPFFFPKRKGINIDSPKYAGHSNWFYRSYLKSFKYNPKCYKKKWNKVNDLDLVLRMYKRGIRMGFLEEITLYILPRPNENEIGIKAVRCKKN